MEEEKYRIPLFDGNNYPDWKFRMTVYLDELYLYLLKHIETALSKLLEEHPDPENGEAAAVAAVQTARNGPIRNDKKSKSRRLQRRDPTGMLKGQKSAYDAWKRLQDVFEKKGKTSKVMLKTKLPNLKHQTSVETSSEQFLKFVKIVR
jgi:hypothetical protein